MKKVAVSYFIWCCLLFSCVHLKKLTPELDPVKALLVAPAQNAPCITDINTSSTQSTITFSWQNSAFTDSYQIYIKNLLNNQVVTQTTTNNALSVTLDLNTPYSWYVMSRSNSSTSTAQSNVWKFYNSGPGITSHPPYPADLQSPSLAETVTAVNGQINLQWSGSDPDNDIASYDVYLGTTTAVTLLKASITQTTFAVSVSKGKIYYWKVVTKDAQGNTSQSSLFNFVVN